MPEAREIEFLVVESAIRQLYGRYSDALWRKDTGAFVECFAAEAVWKIAGLTISGGAQIGSLFEKYMATCHKVMMFTGIPVLDVGLGTATGRVQVTEYSKLRDGRAIRTLGIYYDRYVEAGGRWRFASHHFDLSYYGPPDFSEPYYECKDYGPPPAMPGPTDPTTVRRSG
jgi:ketosteroid isomerase-like protein